jgi:hypothetical protein
LPWSPRRRRRYPHVVALDPVVGHPPAAVGDQPGDRPFHHRPPAPVAVGEGAGGRAAAGGAQLVFVRVDVDRAPAGRGRAALPQWAALAADGEAGLPGRGDVDPIAGWAADRARLLVNGEVVGVNPPGTAAASGAGLIVCRCLAARSAAPVSPLL